MRKFIFFITTLLFIFLTTTLYADYPKIPVFTLKYEQQQGNEELEELNEILQDSVGHVIHFKVKEQISKTLYFNLPLDYVMREYKNMDYNNKNYFKFYPDIVFKIDKYNTLKIYFYTKFEDFTNLDSNNLSKDHFDFYIKPEWKIKIMKEFQILTYLKGRYNLYDNQTKNDQEYTFSFTGTTKIKGIEITGKYKGALTLPLGTESLEVIDLKNTFSVKVQWDPNK